jgi:hypothetical protein
MTMTENNNEFITVFNYFTSELIEQLSISKHIDESTTALINIPALLTQFQRVLGHRQTPQLAKGINKLKQRTEATLHHSRNIIANEFSKTNSHILVAMWNTLQTTIENMLALLLKKQQVRDDIVNLDIPKRWKNKLANETDEEVFLQFVTSWKPVGDNVLDKIEMKLSFFDLSGQVSSELEANMVELNALRNCLVHRAGLVDNKLIEAAPTLNFSFGDQILVNKDMLHKAYDTVSQFGVELLHRINRCKYIYRKITS